jgi:hypothetical protein
MSTENRGPNISDSDVHAATERFKQWVSTLPEAEQRVFGWILTRAAAADPGEAARYGMQTAGDIPIQRLMEDAAGVGQSSREEVGAYRMPDIDPITIWTFKF